MLCYSIKEKRREESERARVRGDIIVENFKMALLVSEVPVIAGDVLCWCRCPVLSPGAPVLSVPWLMLRAMCVSVVLQQPGSDSMSVASVATECCVVAWV